MLVSLPLTHLCYLLFHFVNCNAIRQDAFGADGVTDLDVFCINGDLRHDLSIDGKFITLDRNFCVSNPNRWRLFFIPCGDLQCRLIPIRVRARREHAAIVCDL